MIPSWCCNMLYKIYICLTWMLFALCPSKPFMFRWVKGGGCDMNLYASEFSNALYTCCSWLYAVLFMGDLKPRTNIWLAQQAVRSLCPSSAVNQLHQLLHLQLKISVPLIWMFGLAHGLLIWETLTQILTWREDDQVIFVHMCSCTCTESLSMKI